MTEYINDDSQLIFTTSDLSMAKEKPLQINGGIIFICEKGKAILRLDTDRWEIEEGYEIIALTKKTLFVEETSEDFTVSMMYCSEEIIRFACHRFSNNFFDQIDRVPIFKLKGEEEKSSRTYISMIKNTYNDKQNRYRQVMLSNLLRNFLLYIYDRIQRFTLTKSSKNKISERTESLFNSFMDEILEHCLHHRDVEYYAQKLCITTRYLNSVTNSTTGYSPKEIIDREVINEIKILLHYSELTIQQISYKMHFTDSSSLIRYFKKSTGITPSQFKADNKLP